MTKCPVCAKLIVGDLGMVKTWHKNTKEELDFIAQNWKTTPYPEMAEKLKITVRAISTIVSNLKKQGILDSNHSANRSTKNNLTDKRFGSVIAREYLKTAEDGRAIWLCKCDCGKSVKMSIHALKRNKTVSCGCIESARSINRIVKNAYRDHLRGAKIRGYQSSLSIYDYITIASNKCVYCEAISTRNNPDTEDKIGLNSVDRIDNEPYYKLENTQSVCFICQRMKSDMLHLDFLAHTQKVATKKPPQN